MTLNTLKIKKLHPDATIPTRAHETDAGLDLYSLVGKYLPAQTTSLALTGIAIEIPEGYEAQVRPRSGMTLRTPLRVQIGTIDSGYEGDVGVIIDNIADHQCYINKGDKIAQLVISPIETPSVEVVEEFESESARGSNGFGSTGR